MKVLIIDDSAEKRLKVEGVVRQTASTTDFTWAKSFRSAVRDLEKVSYDLVILDLVLPIRDGEIPSEKGGKQVLDEIMDGSGCRHPSHIICLTAFDNVALEFREEAKRRLVHVVVYQDAKDDWKQPLIEKVDAIKKRLDEARVRPQDYNADIGVITSSPSVELSEVLKLSDFSGEYNQIDALDYFVSKWKVETGREISVVACAAPNMGMTAACASACKLIERWRPRFLVMAGIAAGVKEDLNFGDVLVAEWAYDYGSGKITTLANGQRKFIPSPNPMRIDPGLHALMQKWHREQTAMDVVRKKWHTPISFVTKMAFGVIASGAAVVQDESIVKEVLDNSRKVIGIDMEAYAIFHAAHLSTAPQPRVLVAKSVSDFADAQKGDDWQQYAAFTSAQFIYEVFTRTPELLGNGAYPENS